MPTFCCTSATSDRMPPSPALSARRISTMYFNVMTMNRLQKISDNTPSTLAVIVCSAASRQSPLSAHKAGSCRCRRRPLRAHLMSREPAGGIRSYGDRSLESNRWRLRSEERECSCCVERHAGDSSAVRGGALYRRRARTTIRAASGFGAAHWPRTSAPSRHRTCPRSVSRSTRTSDQPCHIDAAIRGQSLTDFQKTRNAQVLYSVAGRDEGKKDWGKE